MTNIQPDVRKYELGNWSKVNIGPKLDQRMSL